MKRVRDRLLVIAAAALGAVAAGGTLLVRIQLMGQIPGTASYQDPNRMWFWALVMLPLATSLLYVGVRSCLDVAGHAGGAASVIGASMVALGNAIEFQAGHDEGFILFGLGWVLFGIGMVALGGSVRRSGRLDRATTLAVQLVGIFGFLSSIAGPIGLVASSLSAAAWIVIAWPRGRAQRIVR